MHDSIHQTMREAMRLMQKGQLRAATEALQAGLHARPMTVRPTPSTRAPITEPSSDAFTEGTFQNLAGTRRYRLFTPSGTEGRALPLIVMLHGGTQTADDFAVGTRMNELAQERGCMVLYPEQPPTANFSRCWNWFNRADQQRDRGEPALLAGLTESIIEAKHIDRRRVSVAGLSAGAAMAVVLGELYPDLFSAVGVHSGLPYAAADDMMSAFTAMRQGRASSRRGGTSSAVPTIVFHGDRDSTVSPTNGEQVLTDCAAAAGLSSSAATTEHGTAPGGRSYTRRTIRDSAREVVIEHWLIHGAGHAWAGGDPRGTYTDPRGPDASREMLRFFETHRSNQLH